MQQGTQNIFSAVSEEQASKLQFITEATKDFGLSLVQKIQEVLGLIKISDETSEKIVENLSKAKEFLKENKEVVLGVTLIAGLYVANERRAQTLRSSKSRHIHSLTTNPNSPLKRSGSQKQPHSQQQQTQHSQKPLTQRKPKKPSTPKLHYLRAFISQAEQQEDSYIPSDQEDKENPDLSTSTRRTQSIVSDIECMKKKKRINLQPILDLVEEEEQTQDRVFFEMYRTYRES